MRFDLRGLIANSLLEWEGKVSAVAVAGGCNWRCSYCHSWRYVTGVDDLEPIDPERLFALLRENEGWVDGVVFSGGEPTLQPGLAEMMRRTKEMGALVKLHTNGSRPEVIRSLLEEKLLDCLALDYKAPLDGRLALAAGVPLPEAGVAAVRESFSLAAGSGVEREYHTTLCPAFIDSRTLSEMGQALEPEGVWILQPYRPQDCLDSSKSGADTYSPAELEKLEEAARRHHGRVVCVNVQGKK